MSRISARLAFTLLLPLGACEGHGAAPGKGSAVAKPPDRPERTPNAGADDDGPASARSVAVPLHRVAGRRGPIALHRLSDGEIAVTGGLLVARAGETELTQKTGWVAGLPAGEPSLGWQIDALGGRGEDLWLTAGRPEGSGRERRVFRWRAGGWQAQAPAEGEPNFYYADYTTFPDAHAIALRITGEAARLDVLDNDGARPATPRFEAVGLSGTPRPTAIAGLASGELFAGLTTAEAGISGVLRWGPGETTGLFAPLPALESRAPQQVAVLVEASGHEVLIGGEVEIDDTPTPYVARFDGTVWRLIDPPPVNGRVVSLAEGPGPAIWAVVRGDGKDDHEDSLWRLQAHGDWDAWERAALEPVKLGAEAGAWFWDAGSDGWAAETFAPEADHPPAPSAVAVDARGDLWVAAQLLDAHGKRTPWHVALRSRAGGKPMTLLDDGQVFAAQQELLPRRQPRAGDATCPKVYVFLNTVPEASPEVGTPELRAAVGEGPLATTLLGEVLAQGQTQVGLIMGLADYEAHKAAIAALGTKLKLKPKASCGHPPVIRGWRARGG